MTANEQNLPGGARRRNPIAQLLSRRASGPIVPAVDGLRLPAMMLVFLHHLVAAYIDRVQPFDSALTIPADWHQAAQASLFFNFASRAGFGVQLFFVISGFVLALPFLRAVIEGRGSPRLLPFYTRRLVRLEPPYIIALLVFFLWLVADPDKYFVDFLPHLLGSMVYQHNLIWDTPSWVLGIAWLLEVEAQFYLSMPLLASLLFSSDRRVRRRRIVALILAGGLASQLFLEGQGARISMSVLNFLQYFGAGFLLADWHLSEWSGGPSKRRKAWDLAGLAAAIGLFSLLVAAPNLQAEWGLPHRWLGGSLQFLLPWLTLLFSAGVLRGGAIHWAMTRRWIVVAGGMCYTFYLYHALLIGLLIGPAYMLVGRRFGLDAEAMLLYVLCFVPTLAATAVLFLLFEKPFMGLRWGLSSSHEPARYPDR